METIVVCDGCTDDTEAVAAARGVRVLRNERRRGAAYSRNVGAQAASGGIFFFIDADCVVQPDTLALGLKALRDGAAAVFGSYTPETSAAGFLAQFKNYQHYYTHQQGQVVQTSFWSGCGAITREAFEAVSGFDVTLHACEDIEFGWALTQAAYPVHLLKTMQVEHLKVYTLAGLIRSDLRARAIPWTRLIRAGRSELGKLSTTPDRVGSTVWTGVFWTAVGAAAIWPATAFVALPALSAVAWHNRSLLSFVRQRRGVRFMLKSLAALVMHYSICGVGFAAGHLPAPYPRDRAAAPSYRYVESGVKKVSEPAAALEGS
jgi:cellulose synthase/poly-beta-1,6-N-acetylglucosamine synthase-like glycosyltransferase